MMSVYQLVGSIPADPRPKQLSLSIQHPKVLDKTRRRVLTMNNFDLQINSAHSHTNQLHANRRLYIVIQIIHFVCGRNHSHAPHSLTVSFFWNKQPIDANFCCSRFQLRSIQSFLMIFSFSVSFVCIRTTLTPWGPCATLRLMFSCCVSASSLPPHSTTSWRNGSQRSGSTIQRPPSSWSAHSVTSELT